MNTEYESVQLAALLHDIGKFVQRAADVRYAHWKLSGLFIERHSNSFGNPKLIKDLVEHHHEAYGIDHESRPDSLSDDRARTLAFLVSRADNFASSERTDTVTSGGYQAKSALDCVFEDIDIGLGEIPPAGKYPLRRLYTGATFPSFSEREHSDESFNDYLGGFLSEFSTFFDFPYEGMIDSMLSLLQKYLWCIPSDATKEKKDVSLADHLKATCAIASCMYKYHEADGWKGGETAVKDDNLVRLRLVAGDMSGIQNYIYEIAKRDMKGIAKRLRARSFRIALLTEAIALRLLKALDLPLACKILAAGGQFYLLIPNTDQAMDTIKSEADSISKWLLDSYMGELAFSFADVEVKNSDLKQGKFDVVMQGIRTRLAEAKMKKFKSAISSKSVVFELQYHGGGACASCDRRPAKDSSELCDVCELDEELSKKLAVASDQKLWLKVEASPCGVIPLPGGWSASIVKENEAKEGGIICYNLSNSSLLEGIPCGFLPYAGYVPRWRLDEYDQLPEKDKEDEPPREAVEQGCAVKSFSALARSSEGASLLGVLRADVDHLGMVFTLGTLGNASLSRISTLSSFLQFFFSWELIELISKEFPNTYVVYSGGDDVMLVGPWSEIIDLAEKIREKFSDFTGGNPNVTISAGIGTFKKASSIAFTSRITGEILEYAKFAGRDSISLFGTALKWKEFKKAREWMNIFYEGAVTDGEQKTVSAGLLYRLLGYQQMAMDYFKNAGKSAACKALFRPYLAYDIARNLGGEKTKNNKNLADLKDRLISLISANEEQWKLLPVAITWCLYKIRKGE